MATATADLLSLYRNPSLLKRVNSETTSFTAERTVTSANVGSKDYYVNRGLKIDISNPKATAIVIQPFVIEVAPSEDEYLATSSISNVYELGLTPGQALRRYLKSLLDELVWLEKHEENLSSSIHDELRLLQTYLRIV